MARKGEWSDIEVQFLEKHYFVLTPKQCAQNLNRNVSSVYQKATSLGLIKQPRYLESELDYIKANYSDKGPLQISKEMGRGQTAIRNMAVRLGLSVSSETQGKISRANRAKWTDESKAKKSKSQKKYRGCLSPSWKGGVCNLSEMTRGRLYSAWIKFVFERDNYTCRLCGEKGGRLTAHHVRTFVKIRDEVIKQYPYLNMNDYKDRDTLADLVIEAHKLSDGITLCQKCHKKHHLENGVNCGNILPDNAEDNPQPSLPKLKLIVSKTVQRLTVEDSATNTTDTSAPLLNAL